ncbi:MAG: TonB-dependent receptor [Candidatus Solibacter usitatus]|nr:TonB-dependent receptor [Candidatus Solibacter usitatus]
MMLLLALAALVSGRVIDPAGAAVPDARISIRTAALVQSAAVTSGPDGRFTIDTLPPGSYLLRAEKAGFATWAQPVHVSSGQPLELLLRLSVSPVRSEMTVSAEPGEVLATEESARRVNVIPRGVLEERATLSLTQAAAGEAGVSEQRTSPAMGSFFVRGLTGKAVSVYRDGIRYSTSAQRGGVSTFQNLVDPALLETVEMLRGPDSARYGSDSLGGAVNLLSRAPEFASSGRRFAAEAGTFYESASNSFGAQTQASYSTARFALLAALASRRVNTARTGGGVDSHAAVTRFLGLSSTILGERLPDTAFTQYGGSLHSQIQLTPLSHLIVHYERGQQDGARRYDQLLGGDGNNIADLRNLMLDFGYLRFQRFRAGPFEEASLNLSYNTQREERVNQGGQGNPAGAITHQYERAKVWGLQGQASRRAGAHSLLTGLEGYHERMVAPAFSVSPVTGVTTLTRPRIPNGARYLNYGLFVQDVWEPERARRLRLTSALRFGGASYQSRSSMSPLVNGGPLWPNDSLSANALSGRAGVTVRAASGLWIHGQYSRGFRAPNVTDLGTLGIQGNGNYESSYSSLGGRRAQVGDRADDRAVSTGTAVERLRPETSDNVDAGFTLKTSRLRADFTGFWLRMGNSIVSQTLILPRGAVGQPLGDQVISRQLPTGAVYVPAAANPVLVRANYGGATLRGLEQSLKLSLTRSISFSQNLTWVEARDSRTGLPPDIEPGIPAPNLNAGLLWSPASRRFWLEAYSSAADRQSRLSSLALSDRRTGAARSRANIASFFNNGARVRGLVANGVLLPTGETLARVQNRVLGAADAAPLFASIPGYAVFGLRGGLPVSKRSDLMAELSNVTDRSYRGVGWGIDALGRALTIKWKFRL